jgi:hypothetical protein
MRFQRHVQLGLSAVLETQADVKQKNFLRQREINVTLPEASEM